MHGHTHKIRDFINERRNQQVLWGDHALWLQLCSSLDVLEDAELAVAAYIARDVGATEGAKYLVVYGLLQALLLQQDALFNMCESLGIPEGLERYPKLKEIREIRHISVGHPTKKDIPKPTSYHFISRPTLSLEGFQLMSAYPDGKTEFKYVSLPNLIEEQKSYVDDILASVLSELVGRETAHKEKFRMEKLSSVFPDTMGYQFEKLFEGIRKAEQASQGKWALGQIQKTLQYFRGRLRTRGIELDTYAPIGCIYETLEYPLHELGAFFERLVLREQTNINEKAAYIFSFFVEARFRELRQMAQEIDEDYSR